MSFSISPRPSSPRNKPAFTALVPLLALLAAAPAPAAAMRSERAPQSHTAGAHPHLRCDSRGMDDGPAPAGAEAARTTDEAPARKRREFVPPHGVGWPIAMATPVILILGLAWGFIVMARRRRAAPPPLAAPADAGSEPADAGRPARSPAFLVASAIPGERHAISNPPWRIGRSADNDLRLEDPSVAPYHAEIRVDAQGRYALRALDVRNGLFVNGVRVDSAVLEEGDRIRIGARELRFTGRAAAGTHAPT